MEVKLISYLSPREVLSFLSEMGLSLSLEELMKHISFTFSISGISRACSHQLVRHRMASYTQQSQRYTRISRLIEEAIIPESVRLKGYEEDYRNFLIECQKFYESMINAGIPEEDARFILPNATPTNIIVTMTAKNLYHFFGLRCCYRAQWEIRELADKMLIECRRVAPEMFRKAGPYCFQKGYCEEGKLSCGRIEEVKEKYSKLGYE